MREFWSLKRQQMEKEAFIPANDINFTQEMLVDWLKRNGKISAPSRVIASCSPNAIKAFKSFGIIQEQNNRISFCHQSYLDFLIAIRLIDSIDNGGNILEWLGPKEKQSLFRREQLRQALA